MNTISITPDKKYFTKDIFIYLTIGLFLLLPALALQIIVPLADDKVSFSVFAMYVWPIAGGVILILLLIGVPLSKIYYNNLEYHIESDRIRIHKGIIGRYQQNIPFHMITDFMLSRTIYDRLLGIAAINIQTAGQTMNATGYEGSIAGLTDWEPLMTELRKRINREQKEYDSETPTIAKHTPPDQMAELVNEVKHIRQLLEKK